MKVKGKKLPLVPHQLGNGKALGSGSGAEVEDSLPLLRPHRPGAQLGRRILNGKEPFPKGSKLRNAPRLRQFQAVRQRFVRHDPHPIFFKGSDDLCRRAAEGVDPSVQGRPPQAGFGKLHRRFRRIILCPTL